MSEIPTEVPAGMREVSKDEFFKKMGPLNVHPCTRPSPYYSSWRFDGGAGREVGRSYPGWKNPGDPARYFLA